MQTQFRCRAPHPNIKANGQHKVMIGIGPGRWLPTGRILDTLEDVLPGCLGVYCPHSDCKAVTEYELCPTRRLNLAAIRDVLGSRADASVMSTRHKTNDGTGA